MLALLSTLFTVNVIALPGAPPIGIDYVAYDAAHHRLWVPAGGTGKVDVVDTVIRSVTAIDKFVTKPSATAGRPAMGPSSVTFSDTSAWIGNRGDDSLCSFDRATLAKGACVTLPVMPDGVQFVRATNEVWVTAPREHSLLIVDVRSKPRITRTLKLEGEPEGYAVDEKRGVFYTNLEDKDRTVAIDITTKQVQATWPSGCGGAGPRGLALDATNNHLLVACTDGVIAIDLEHAHKEVGRIATGKGVDNIDFLAEKKRLYVASREDASLTIVDVNDLGALSIVTKATTSKGARNAVADEAGTAYVPDSLKGQVLVVPVVKK